ncbi:DUF4391 domain-containing protein [Bacillus subtilis]|nr:DUF4391 domain-containing protein [Bacillus subtilis]
MIDVLYQWPPAAKLGSRVPKGKFYELGNVGTAVREMFVSEVHRITWIYKLAEETINLPGSTGVPEVQVFQIDTHCNDVSEPVLTAIDKAIPYPIVFEVARAFNGTRQVRMVAAHKVLGYGAPKLSDYYATDWQSSDAYRRPLPAAVTLAGLYTALLEPLTPITVRPGEEASNVAARLNTVRKLEREIAALERKLQTEPQLNRKIELRRSLKTKQAQLEQQR